ncbi:hypothetical protein DFP72DRAFT_1053640 [Ephemerocybe angulata]|uniref:Uncharacterized protein n=1 Tax=Ephemerocybe angulata TaxID=980116 RepID=A0A8H6H961_9AGAR|nr:hypothetical protein DFP72DRAFT_1053640 [Tulosesus angulatus]
MRGAYVVSDSWPFFNRSSCSGNEELTHVGRPCCSDFHVDVDVRSFETVEGIDNLIECVQEACARHLASGISSERTPLLNPILRGLKEDSIQSVIVLRKYFKFITVSSHRKALSRLLSADHFLAVERYRHITYDNGQPIPRCERRCRYCRVFVEDEVHVLFHCSALQLLVARRQKLFARVNVLIGETAGNDLRHLCLSDSPRAVHRFLDHPDLCPTFAKYVFDILKFFPL